MTGSRPSVARAKDSEQALTRVSVELPLAIGRTLDYGWPNDIGAPPALHAAVEVTVGTRPHVGLITAIHHDAPNQPQKLKDIRRLICAPLPSTLIDLAQFVAHYYQVSLGMACGLITPMDAPPPPEPVACN